MSRHAVIAADTQLLKEGDAIAFDKERRETITALGSDQKLRDLSLQWMEGVTRHKYSHHFDWLGVPIIQFPQDIVALQEIIWRCKPDLIVETGVARGGSLIFYASMLQLLGHNGMVCGIDLDIRPHNRLAIESHPLARRIQLIEGSSIDDSVVRQVHAMAKQHRNIMVVLDSDHTHDHVLNELRLYSPFVTAGQYLVVLDTVIEDFSPGYFTNRNWDVGNSPRTAVNEFLRSNDRFNIDQDIDRQLLISVAPGGYLRCIR